jgi:hypothetical protein
MEKECNAKFIPEKEKRQSLNFRGVFTDLHEDNDENTSCGFCGLKYSSVQSVERETGLGARNVKRGTMKCVLGP